MANLLLCTTLDDTPGHSINRLYSQVICSPRIYSEEKTMAKWPVTPSGQSIHGETVF